MVYTIPLRVNTCHGSSLSSPPCHPPPLLHISASHRTTVRLERVFWMTFDLLAEKTGRNWSEWVSTELANKPAGTGAASWLRVRCLIQSIQGA